jgi:6-phosphofructokinase 1
MTSNLLITMSGGTTTVINGTLAGIISAAQCSSQIGCIYAGYGGIVGLLEGRIVDLTSLTSAELVRISNTPGSSVIGTSRVAILNQMQLEQLSVLFNRLNIHYFINIGGNGTIKQTRLIAHHMGDRLAVAAAPKTVDNDLGDATFHQVFFTPGFPSCVNYWTRKLALLNIENIGSSSHDRLLIAQTFGRETGFIAGAVRMADTDRKLPLLILMPEDQQPLDTLLGRIDTVISRYDRALIVISEGYHIGDVGEYYDATGQVMYGSSHTTAAQLLVTACIDAGIPGRSFIPTIDQRQACDDRLIFDLELAQRLGTFAVEKLMLGDTAFLATVRANFPADPLVALPFTSFNNFSRSMPPSWIDIGNFDVTDQYIDYLKSFFSYSRYETAYDSYEGHFASPLPVVHNWENLI